MAGSVGKTGEPQLRYDISYRDYSILERRDIMNDFELLSIVLMILAIIVNLMIALINEHNKNSHNNSLDD